MNHSDDYLKEIVEKILRENSPSPLSNYEIVKKASQYWAQKEAEKPKPKKRGRSIIKKGLKK